MSLRPKQRKGFPRAANLGGGRQVRVLRHLANGAYGEVFAGDADGRAVAIKVVKGACAGEAHVASVLQRRLAGDARLVARFAPAEGVQFDDGGALIMPLYAHGSLRHVLERSRRLGPTPEPAALWIAVEMTRLLEGLRRARVVHGDLKLDNVVVDAAQHAAENAAPWALAAGRWPSLSLVCIDFGRALDLDLHPHNAMFAGGAFVNGYACPEAAASKPWRHQPDSAAAAGVLHRALYSTPMRLVERSGRWHPAEPARRYHCDVWPEIFETLLNDPARDDLIRIRRLACACLAAMKNAEALIKAAILDIP